MVGLILLQLLLLLLQGLPVQGMCQVRRSSRGCAGLCAGLLLLLTPLQQLQARTWGWSVTACR